MSDRFPSLLPGFIMGSWFFSFCSSRLLWLGFFLLLNLPMVGRSSALHLAWCCMSKNDIQPPQSALKAYALGWYENNDKKMDARYMCSTASNFPKNSLACHVPVPVMPGKGPRSACVKKRMTRIESRRNVGSWKLDLLKWSGWTSDIDIRR